MAKEKKHVHFIGIGGIGMSALARYFLAQKWVVSGSDLAKSPILSQLHKDGVNVKIGHKKGGLPKNTTLVVYSQAIRPANPELEQAGKLGAETRVLSYPEAIGELTRQYKTIAVSGAHGKSTTTALVALILKDGGLDPTVIVGANLKEFAGGNFRQGKSEYLVLEADEFGRAFLHYSPIAVVITNIDREHLDIYKNLADIKNTFLQFLENIGDGGTIIINRGDKNCFSLKKKIIMLARRKKLRVIWYSLKDSEAKKIKKSIKIPGQHNVANALAAYRLGRLFGIPERKIIGAIGAYRGAGRRMEYRGKFISAGNRTAIIPVYDDYAHHPAEIAATLAAFREKFPEKTIICVFQPHQAKRLEMLFDEFQNAFNAADIALILPLYKVPGRDEASPLDSKTLVCAIQKRQPEKLIFYLNDPKNLKSALNALIPAHKAAAIVMMGAGDIVKYTGTLLAK